MPNTKLRLDDLVSRGKAGRETAKLMNVKVPPALLERIGALANQLRVTKTEVVIAILNEGLDPRHRAEGLEATAEDRDSQGTPLYGTGL